MIKKSVSPEPENEPQRQASGDRRPSACSRFQAARIEELLQASNDLSEGEEIRYEDARDLALYALDEMERVRNTYQARLGDLMLKAMDLTTSFAEAMPFPENDPTLATRGLEPVPENHAGDGQPSGLPAAYGSASSE